MEPKVRLQGYGYNPFCSHSSRCLAVLVWQSALRKLFVHPKYGWNGTVSRAFPLIALIALGAFFHSTPGSAQKKAGVAFLFMTMRMCLCLLRSQELIFEAACRDPIMHSAWVLPQAYVSPNPLNLRGADSPPKFRGQPSKNTLKQGALADSPPKFRGWICQSLKFRGFGPTGTGLVAPYRAILRYYRCDTPYRAIPFQVG